MSGVNTKKKKKKKKQMEITSIAPLLQCPHQPITIHGHGFGEEHQSVKVIWLGFREELVGRGKTLDDKRIETRIPRKAVGAQTYDVYVETKNGTTLKFGYTLGSIV